MDIIGVVDAFLRDVFPDCLTAIVGGSLIRGEGTATSDADLFVIVDSPLAPYRESFRYRGLPIEVFVHTLSSYREFFASDCKRGRPSLPQVCSEGVVLRDAIEVAQKVKAEAKDLLQAGPEALTNEQIRQYRYVLTDLLDDLPGAPKDEALFVVNKLSFLVPEFQLRLHQHWIGDGKWTIRQFKKWSPIAADTFLASLQEWYQMGNPGALIAYVDHLLEHVGGRLFEGFVLGKGSDRESQ